MRTSGRLIDRNGDVRFGVFEEPVSEINYRDYDLRSPMDRRRGRLARHFGFHQFQFLGALSETLVFGCALIDIRTVGQAFLYFYEPLTRKLTEWSFRAPLALGTHFDQRPEDGSAMFRSGDNHFAMTATAEPRQRQLWVRLAAGVEVDAVFDEQEPLIQPMWISTRAGASGFVFARKTAGARVTGTIRWDGRTLDLGEHEVFGHNDWSAGYMRRETFWNWGCLAGRLPDGRTIGMNVSCGVNETGHSENCFWVDGRLHRLGAVSFDYDRRDLMHAWSLHDSDGRLELEFTPEGSHVEKLNALLLASNFHQMFGRYRGRLVTQTGQTVDVQGLLGYAEKHYAKW
ncbi:MAG TPA: DUF2804 domain-containing protein [Candidatus Limnocylindrales bacterium]|nr:DUF2804 domain-containing protein [Candidatus Limnocylindrales bacterium]